MRYHIGTFALSPTAAIYSNSCSLTVGSISYRGWLEADMAPQRFRGLHEDSRSESSNTREKHPMATQSGVSKVRRYPTTNSGIGSNLKDVTAAPTPKNGSDSSTLAEKVRDAATVMMRGQSANGSICVDAMVVLRHCLPQRVPAIPSLGYSASLYLGLQPVYTHTSRYCSLFAYHGPIQGQTESKQRSARARCEERLQCCHGQRK